VHLARKRVSRINNQRKYKYKYINREKERKMAEK